MDELVKEQKIEELQKKISEIVDLNAISELIKSNEIEFDYKDIKYRVKKPNLYQKQEAYQKKIEKFTKLLDEVDEAGELKYKLEEDLKKSFLKRGIDIDEMTRKMFNLSLKRDDLMLKLGEALKNKAPDNECKVFKDEVVNINNEIQNISIKKTQLLESSIEKQCLIRFYTYLTFVVAEKLIPGKDLGEGNKEADKWVRAWNTWEEFENIDETLLNTASYYITIIGGSEFE